MGSQSSILERHLSSKAQNFPEFLLWSDRLEANSWRVNRKSLWLIQRTIKALLLTQFLKWFWIRNEELSPWGRLLSKHKIRPTQTSSRLSCTPWRSNPYPTQRISNFSSSTRRLRTIISSPNRNNSSAALPAFTLWIWIRVESVKTLLNILSRRETILRRRSLLAHLSSRMRPFCPRASGSSSTWSYLRPRTPRHAKII